VQVFERKLADIDDMLSHIADGKLFFNSHAHIVRLNPMWKYGIDVENRKLSVLLSHLMPSIWMSPFEFLLSRQKLDRSWEQSHSRTRRWRFGYPSLCHFDRTGTPACDGL